MERFEMIKQLNERMVFVPNIETLPMEQLEQIYRGFIVPQPRREQRERQQQPSQNAETALSLPLEMEQLRKRIQVVSMAENRKRGIQNDANTIAQRKRIKMDLL
ncbi:uncharacterized protein LOC6649132 [Drosophila willistoni]|nr:uncharacterized protein LOC6649132 [Drosophila willistoni]